MSNALQVALFLASVAVVVFVAFIIPAIVSLCQRASFAARQLEEVKSDLKLLIQDTRAVVQRVNELTDRAHQQMDEVDRVVRTARGWSDRADRIVGEVGDIVEAPIFTVARVIGIVQEGLHSFLNAVTNRNHRPGLKDPEPHAETGSPEDAASRKRTRDE